MINNLLKHLKNLFIKPKTVTLAGVDGWISLKHVPRYERREKALKIFGGHFCAMVAFIGDDGTPSFESDITELHCWSNVDYCLSPDVATDEIWERLQEM